MLFLIYLIHVTNQAENLTGIAPFIIVETNQLEKLRIYLVSAEQTENT